MKEVSVEVQGSSSINWKKVGMVAGATAVVLAAGYGGYRYGKSRQTLAEACDAETPAPAPKAKKEKAE